VTCGGGTKIVDGDMQINLGAGDQAVTEQVTNGTEAQKVLAASVFRTFSKRKTGKDRAPELSVCLAAHPFAGSLSSRFSQCQWILVPYPSRVVCERVGQFHSVCLTSRMRATRGRFSVRFPELTPGATFSEQRQSGRMIGAGVVVDIV
jgi:hypothetical protein